MVQCGALFLMGGKKNHTQQISQKNTINMMLTQETTSTNRQ